MSMTPSRLGQINGAGDAEALFLKVFSGEILTEFERASVTRDRHWMRTIENGKSASFPALGSVTAGYHAPGTELTGNVVNHNEVIIPVKKKLITHVFVDEVDELKNHYDVRAPYSRSMGLALAKQFDKHILLAGYKAARSSGVVTGRDGGATIYDVDPADPEILANAIFAAAQTLDEKDVPEDGRSCYLKPAQYYTLLNAPKVINKDYGGKGSYSDGKVLMIAGIEIVKTNNLTHANVLASDINSFEGAFTGDYSDSVGLIMTKEAVGTVKLLDMKVESETSVRTQGTLLAAKYVMGHGAVRTDCAVELNRGAAP